MRKIYLDSASSTIIDPKVIEVMKGNMESIFGNPSSIHSFGREAKIALETSRKTIAKYLNTSPNNITFTSGGTESNNWIINKLVDNLAIKNIITTEIEHKSILIPLKSLIKKKLVNVINLKLDGKGNIDINELELLLKKTKNTFVVLMHANNEIGNMIDLDFIGNLCKKYDAYFHSDTAQTIGHYNFDLNRSPLDFCIGSAHKFHGPKGIGFLYMNDNAKLKPFVCGGGQELNLRSGTENLVGIIGMAKAIEIAHENLESDKDYIENLKFYLIAKLKKEIPYVKFNGNSSLTGSLYTLLNIHLPCNISTEMALLKLDMDGIAVSAGSACSSGTFENSHVIEAIKVKPDVNIRISLSRFNTREELDYFVEKLKF